MRIGLLTSLARGGPVEHALVLARELAAAGHEVRAICATGPLADRFCAVGADAIELPLRHGLDAEGAAARRAATRGLDVLHAHDRRSALWMRVLPRESRSVVLVQTVHGLPDPFLPPPAGPVRPGWRAMLAYRGLDAKLAWRCDAVLTPTEAMRRQLTERLGYPKRRLEVVPNGVAMPPAEPAGGDAVGTLSVLDAVKDLGTLLEAAVRLPGVPFAVHGTGPQEAALRARATELGLDDRMHFRGHVPAAEALSSLRVLVISSVMENAPMSMLEAMARGVPVVATAVGGIPELAPPGTASLVPPGNPDALAAAIRRLLEHPDEAREQARCAREHVGARLSADTMARSIAAIYERELDRRRA